MATLSLPGSDVSLLLTLPMVGWPLPARLALVVVLCAVPLGLLVVLYRLELRLVSRSLACVLLGLRLSVLLVLLGLVCLQPIVAREVQQVVPGRVIVAVDRSASMDIRDPHRSKGDQLRLARILDLHAGQVATSRLDQWIEDHSHNRPPRLGPHGEPDDPAGRRTHDDLLARVNALTRYALASQLLADPAGRLLQRIEKRHRPQIVEFAREIVPLNRANFRHLPKTLENASTSEDSRLHTDIHAVLTKALSSGSSDGPLVAVVLLSDGQHNLGSSPVEPARKLGQQGVPIYPIVVGEEKSPPDAALVSLRGPDHTLFKGVEATVEVRVKIAGLPAQPFALQLRRDDRAEPVAEKTIAHDGQDRLYSETLTVQFDEVGTHRLTASIQPVRSGERELRTDNNRQSTTVSVADDKAAVLLVDGEARWEYHYLATALGRDPLVKLSKVLFSQPRLRGPISETQRQQLQLPSDKWPDGPEALAEFACVVLGDVDPENLPLARRQQLERFVAESGGTLVVVAGKRAMPLAYPERTPGDESDPLRRLLPVESPRVLAPAKGLSLSLTPAAEQARFMELDSDPTDNARLWAGFPRPWGWAVAGRAKPGATVLASWLDPAEPEPAPAAGRATSERERRNAVVARHNYGFGRVLFVGLDSTWRWRYRAGDVLHHRFWGQLIRWAAADRPLVAGNRLVRFGTPQPVYQPGEAVEVVARLSESLGELRLDLQAGAKILRLPQGNAEPERTVALVPLESRAGQPRVRQGQVNDLPPGQYAIELAIPQLADKLFAENSRLPLRASFSVRAAPHQELFALEANRPLLDELAAASRGKVFQPWELDDLEAALLQRGEVQIEHHEQRLWQWWGVLVVVVALLSLEWVLRKLSGLP